MLIGMGVSGVEIQANCLPFKIDYSSMITEKIFIAKIKEIIEITQCLFDIERILQMTEKFRKLLVRY